MKEIIPTTGVLQYEQFGFTNCVRFKDVLYLSGIGALGPAGQIVGSDIEAQTVQTYQNIQQVLQAAGSEPGSDFTDYEFRSGFAAKWSSLCGGTEEDFDITGVHQCGNQYFGADGARASP